MIPKFINLAFAIVNACLEVIQVCLFLFSFLTTVYWMFYITHIKGVEFIYDWYEPLLSLVKFFYTYNPNYGGRFDLSLVIIAFSCIIISGCIDILRNTLLQFKVFFEKADKIAKKIELTKELKSVQHKLENEIKLYSQVILGISIVITKVKSESVFEVNEEEEKLNYFNVYNTSKDVNIKDEKVVEILHAIFRDIQKHLRITHPVKVEIKNNLIIFKFNNFTSLDDFIVLLLKIKKAILTMYQNNEYTISIDYLLDSIKKTKTLNMDRISEIMNLNIGDGKKVVATKSFYQNSKYLNINKFSIVPAGTYHLVYQNVGTVIEELFLINY